VCTQRKHKTGAGDVLSSDAPQRRSADTHVTEQLSLSRGDKWDPTPSDETVDLISSLDRPAFEVLDYLNWCKFLDRDMKASIATADE